MLTWKKLAARSVLAIALISVLSTVTAVLADANRNAEAAFLQGSATPGLQYGRAVDFYTQRYADAGRRTAQHRMFANSIAGVHCSNSLQAWSVRYARCYDVDSAEPLSNALMRAFVKRLASTIERPYGVVLSAEGLAWTHREDVHALIFTSRYIAVDNFSVDEAPVHAAQHLRKDYGSIALGISGGYRGGIYSYLELAAGLGPDAQAGTVIQAGLRLHF